MSPQKKEEQIDLSKLTQRELLILLNRDVEDIKNELQSIQRNEAKIMLKVNTIEVKGRVWGSLAGFVGAIVAVISERILLK